MLDEELMQEIEDEARTWLGIKFVHQGRTRFGVDCLGLLIQVAKAKYLMPQDFNITSYTRRAHGYDFLAEFVKRDELKRVDKSELQQGDLIIFKDKLFPCHCGISTIRYNVSHFIHSHALRKKVTEEKYDFEWKDKIVAIFRFKVINNG